jgi:long-subunit fatty acid transport protein
MLLLLAASFSGRSHAAAVAAPGVIGGPDAGAATASPIAPHYNPGALGGVNAPQVLLDAQVAAIRLDLTATRNDGLDPASCEEVPGPDPSTWTGCEPYDDAKARVLVPAFIAGVAVPVIPDRLTLGFAATDVFVGGGDYRASEPDDELPFVGHQRYFGVSTRIVTVSLIPAAALTVIDGLHVGAGLRYTIDVISATRATNLGLEGRGPLGPDPLLEAKTLGSHLGWNVGLFFDRVKQAQVGISYARNGTFQSEGDGTVTVPQGPLSPDGDTTLDARVSVELPLADILYAAVASQLTSELTLGAGLEYQMWGACCSDRAGDLALGVTDANGDQLGLGSLTVATEQYSPRRLDNAMNLNVNGGYQISEPFWLGLRLGYNQGAVPDYALSATNLDFDNAGLMIAARYQLDALTLGLTYGRYVLFEHSVTDSAWGAATDSPDYVDDRFSPGPEPPLQVSANGTYAGAVDIFGIRAGASF